MKVKKFEFTTITVDSSGDIVSQNFEESVFFEEHLSNGATLEMVAIPSGSFVMGSPEGHGADIATENPQHSVTVSGFFMGKYPVTQVQWEAVMESNPSYDKGNNLPLERVSWNDATEFCQKLSRLTGRNYRLPSEAEWEYACRAGTTTPFHFGEQIVSDLANYNCIGNRVFRNGAKFRQINRGQTTEVGSFPPNAFGLYDMHGNVWEWCQDYWHKNYEGAPLDGSAWEIGGDSNYRLLRGGSWCSDFSSCHAACRAIRQQDERCYTVGFRVVCDVTVNNL